MAVVLAGISRAALGIGAEASHIALGTGSTAPVNSNTTLESEAVRLPVIAYLAQSGIVQIRGLFPTNVLPTVTNEVGLFMNGTSDVDSGELLIRTLESFTRGVEDLLVIFEITLSA